MFKITSLVHIMLMTVLMGILVLVVVAVPSLSDQAATLIPAAAAAGFVVAIPLSMWVAKRILALSHGT